MNKFIYIICLCVINIIQGYAQIQGSAIPTLEDFCQSIEDTKPLADAPLIGISASHQAQTGGSSVSGTYIQSVIKAGGIPVIIPVITDMAVLKSMMNRLDGVIMTGGGDINPLWFNEEPWQQLGSVDPVRDEFDLAVIRMAVSKNIPLLGICRGEQLMNVAFGGTLYQDMPSQHTPKPIKHAQSMPFEYGSHTVSITPGSVLENILQKQQLVVNSSHHQAVKDIAPGFRVSAVSPDGIIEAIEAWPDKAVIGVQWHPEAMTVAGDTTMIEIFRFIIDQAKQIRAKNNKP